MILNAADTWGVVVGIDEYDDQHIPRLTGAARDAAHAVRWLLGLGVPNAQIRLHSEPSAAARDEVANCGVARQEATFAAVTRSVLDLVKNQGGERLFVFLSGHGLFEPSAQRVFLTRDADATVMANIGLDWLTDVLAGSRFRRVFVVMDGCLNLPYSESVRSRFGAGTQSAYSLKTPRSDTTVVACYSASQGERALELDGRGLFMRELLTALDIHQPSQAALLIDDTTGVRQLDIRRAILEHVGPLVTQRAAAAAHVQHPGVFVRGEGESWSRLPVLEVEPDARVQVKVVVDPGEACTQVKQIRLTAEDTAWERLVPALPTDQVQVPVVSLLPAGTELSVRCRLRPGATVRVPAPQEHVVTADWDVVFRLEPAEPAGPPSPQPQAAEFMCAVTTVDPVGHTVPGMTPPAYRAVEDVLTAAPLPVRLEKHESGPVLRTALGEAHLLLRVARDVARAVARETPAQVGVVVRHDPVDLPAPRVRPQMDDSVLQALATLLGDEPILAVGEREYSAVDLLGQGSVEVDPGPVSLHLRLPWGSASARVVADVGETANVPMSAEVGVLPLAMRLAVERPDAAPAIAPALLPLDSAPTAVQLLDTTSGKSRQLVQTPEGWVLPAGKPPPPWRALAIVEEGSARHAVMLHPTLATAWSGLSRRAEPLANLPSAAWFTLVSSGRLEALSPERSSELTYAKWDEPVLGLAGAYSCYAQRRDGYLETVLNNLSRLQPVPPDVAVLRAALDRRHRRHSEDVREQLAQLANNWLLPVLRWGVSIGVLAAEHYELTQVADRLRRLEKDVQPDSVWTVLRLPSDETR